MKAIVVLLACLLVLLAGCGGGSSVGNSVIVKGEVASGGRGQVTAVKIFQNGHAGEADYLVASVSSTGSFELTIPSSGWYDVQILYDCDGGLGTGVVHNQKTIPGVQVSAPLTDLGTIDLDIPVS